MLKTPWRSALLFGLCGVVFAAFRLRWLGHLLTWDEAMNLCSIRSFVSDGTDVFSFWFWRHPPLFFFLALPLAPLASGFAERVELLSVVVGVCSLGMLFLLNRKVFGDRVALWSCFLLSVMPSSMFYDVWLKRDAPVSLLGLGALLLVTRKRPLLAGVCLGGALLAKETAVFYVGAALLLWLLENRARRWRGAAALLLSAFCVSAWWYVILKSNVDGVVTIAVPPGESVGLLERICAGFAKHIHFASGADRWAANWQGGWHYYLARLPHDLGVVSAALAVAGVAVLPVKWARCVDGGRWGMTWPLLLLVPSVVFLSVLPGKVPWVTVSLYPAWATLAAVCFVSLLDRIASGARTDTEAGADGTRRSARSENSAWLVTVGIALMVFMHAMALRYEYMLTHDGSRQLVAARNSLQIAEALNQCVSEEDRVLVTSFHYWQGPSPGYVCPVFTAYLKRKPAMLVRSHLLTFDEYLADIKEHKIDWTVLSPPPGPEAQALFDSFKALGLTPCRLDGAFIFDTRAISN